MKLRTVFSFANFFLGWARTTMSLFPSVHPSVYLSAHLCVCPTIRLSVAHHISRTVKHLIMIFGTLVLNDDISRGGRGVLIFLKFWFFGLLGGGVKGQKIAQNKKYIGHVPYFRTSTAYDHDFWYTCVNNDLSRPFFHLFEIFFFQVVRGGGGGKKVKNCPK